MEKKLLVPDMRCEHCEARIQKALDAAGIAGKIDLAAKTVTVKAEDGDKAFEEIYDLGFTPEWKE